MFNLKDIQKKLEGVYDVQFTDSLFADKPCLKINNKIYELNISLGRLKVDDFAEYIGVDFWNKKKLSGIGRPCRTMEEVYRVLDSIELPRKEAMQLSLF